MPAKHGHKPNCLKRVISGLAVLTLSAHPLLAQQTSVAKPNILFIAIDDLNDWVGCLGGYPGKVHTPNIDRLAKKGILFTQAYCSSPMCNPSRTALWTGKRPSTTGVYGQYSQWDDNRTTIKTIFQLFKDNGYQLYGGGKIFHHGKEVHDAPFFDELYPFNYAPYPANEKNAGFLRYARHSITEEEMPDYKLVSWCIERLNRKEAPPFFIVPGIFKPHTPLWIPEKFFDLYPLDKIVEPTIPKDEFDDIPEWGKTLANKKLRYDPIEKSGQAREVIQAYLAAISFVDNQVGRLVDAVENNPGAENTIIVLWSDHGFHLGEKYHFAKATLWEESARIPFIIYAPGFQNGKICDRPMDSIDIYPTLAELCRLTPPADLDGQSMVPLLKNPKMKWKPAITMLQRNNETVRSEEWRYIRYADGSEELYRHRDDPEEHHNLAGHKEYGFVKKALSASLPETPVIDGLPYPFHTGYIPPEIREEFEATKPDRQKNWIPPARYSNP